MNAGTVNFEIQEHRNIVPKTINDLLDKYPLEGNIHDFDLNILRGVDVSRASFLRSATDAKVSVVRAKVHEKSVDSMLIGAGTGMAIGGVVGGVTGGCVMGPAGAIGGTSAGVLAGGLVGVSVGAAVGYGYGYLSITQDPLYKNWKTACLDSEQYQAYKMYISREMPNCNDFMCPISNDFPNIPVRSPSGHIYDLEHISEHLDRKYTERSAILARLTQSNYTQAQINTRLAEFDRTICPMRGEKFNKSDLVYDKLFTALMRRKFSQFLEGRERVPQNVIDTAERYVSELRRVNGVITAQHVTAAIRHMDRAGIRNQTQRELVIGELLR